MIYKGDWAAGLPLLAGCNDAAWSAIAKAELANPVAVADRMKVADLWFDLGQKQMAARPRAWERGRVVVHTVPSADRRAVADKADGAPGTDRCDQAGAAGGAWPGERGNSQGAADGG